MYNTLPGFCDGISLLVATIPGTFHPQQQQHNSQNTE